MLGNLIRIFFLISYFIFLIHYISLDNTLVNIVFAEYTLSMPYWVVCIAFGLLLLLFSFAISLFYKLGYLSSYFFKNNSSESFRNNIFNLELSNSRSCRLNDSSFAENDYILLSHLAYIRNNRNFLYVLIDKMQNKIAVDIDKYRAMHIFIVIMHKLNQCEYTDIDKNCLELLEIKKYKQVGQWYLLLGYYYQSKYQEFYDLVLTLDINFIERFYQEHRSVFVNSWKQLCLDHIDSSYLLNIWENIQKIFCKDLNLYLSKLLQSCVRNDNTLDLRYLLNKYVVSIPSTKMVLFYVFNDIDNYEDICGILSKRHLCSYSALAESMLRIYNRPEYSIQDVLSNLEVDDAVAKAVLLLFNKSQGYNFSLQEYKDAILSSF